MTKGRKPKPTAIKVAAGNPGKRPLNNGEAKFAPAMLACPANLGTEGRTEWKRITTELYNAGMLTKVDRGALFVYCVEWQIMQQALKAIKGNPNGIFCLTDKGNYVQFPAVGTLHTAEQILLKAAAEFGMTPSARSRVQALTDDKQSMTLAEELFAAVQVKRAKKEAEDEKLPKAGK